MRAAHGEQEDLVDDGWSRSPLMRVLPGRSRAPRRRLGHWSSYMSHVFVYVHVQNESLACKVSAVGMALSDGLLGFELGKYFDGEVERYLRMIGTQLNCRAGVINATW